MKGNNNPTNKTLILKVYKKFITNNIRQTLYITAILLTEWR